MRLSRLRLRLAAAFALAFAVGLGALAALSLGYLWRESNRRLSERLGTVARGVSAAVAREMHETPDSSFRYAAEQVAAEWPQNAGAFAIVGEAGEIVAARDSAREAVRVVRSWASRGQPRELDPASPPDLRVVTERDTTVLPGGTRARWSVVAFGSTEGIERDTELLGESLAVAAPLILLVSLAFGYGLARRALQPVDGLREAISRIGPADLDRRLPVHVSPDEVDALAEQFNALLGRLDDAQRRNRGFVRETAHQIRTPLTLVLGEAAHELAGAGGDGAARAALARIQRAAEQMRRRVDELFLLAEAEAGETVRLEDDVELDGLALECTDLMRARAQALGRTLALGDVAPVVVRGNEHLLREALLELLENGCRHGAATAPVTTAVRADADGATIEVRSAVDAGRTAVEAPGQGLGRAIVSWIAAAHDGRFSRRAEDGVEIAELHLPRRPAEGATRAGTAPA
jgi:signal transduction histidine kinase